MCKLFNKLSVIYTDRPRPKIPRQRKSWLKYENPGSLLVLLKIRKRLPMRNESCFVNWD